MSRNRILILLFFSVLIIGIISLFFGRFYIGPITVIKIVISKILPIKQTWPETMETVILQVRLPRVFLAMLVGASLSISGAAFQGLFQNPLVSPDILGVSSAAGFGAAIAILLSGNLITVQITAFCFGLVGVFVTYLLSRVHKMTPTLMLVLSGVVISAFFSALISLVKYIADPYEKLPVITFWLMGSLGTASVKDVYIILMPVIVGINGLLFLGWKLNILSMGDEEARTLGLKTELFKGIVVICATILTASAVCVSGLVGWVGLLIPHVSRMIVGPDHCKLLPASLAIGAAYLVIIDDIARSALPSEVPLGILTAVIGLPFFAYLIRKTKGDWK